MTMLLSALVRVSNNVAATRSRLKKIELLTQYLRALAPNEIEIGVGYLTGVLPQGRIGLGYATLREVRTVPCATHPSLTLLDIDQNCARIAEITGKGSQTERLRLLSTLFSKAIEDEQVFLVKLFLGELRQGALEGVMVDAIARAAEVPATAVRRAVMLAGGPALVAHATLTEGRVGLDRFALELMKPIRPMLAQPAEDLAHAIESLGQAALEYKLDGARVQVHKVKQEVRVYSRQLNDVTASVPELVETVRGLPTQQLILDGEAIALSPDGRPQPFQTTMRRFGRKLNVEQIRNTLPLSAFYFDILHTDGVDLIDKPTEERMTLLADVAPRAQLTPKLVTDELAAAERFMQQALANGHEGIMAKALDASYQAGSRGSSWLKLKPAHTLDLVVLAVEWGSGRRKGWLSNLHVGARDAETGTFVMLGKTFKGLTDKMLEWQTKRLLELEIGREGYVVHVRPELVVEIMFNELQQSPQYPAGLALRF
ncbi:MAG: ATP-dependent DNA ligase, partial [Gammaproteobacteria bacterium]|nr:ATP-dependent DNA ligase [Gammaproteobacteria bacterium]